MLRDVIKLHLTLLKRENEILTVFDKYFLDLQTHFILSAKCRLVGLFMMKRLKLVFRVACIRIKLSESNNNELTK